MSHHTHEHHHHHHGSCGHHHHDSKRNLIQFFIGLALFVVALFLNEGIVKDVFYIASLALAGQHVITEGIGDTISETKERKRFYPNIHLLMALAALGALIIGEFREASLLIIIFAGAHLLEDYAQSQSRKEITNLLKLNPTTARRIKSDGTLEQVDVQQLAINDRLRVLNGDKIPTDGVVLSGLSVVDQSAMTGESIPVEVSVGSIVYGSTLNGYGTFDMEVTKDSTDTVYAQIVALVSQSQVNISTTAALIKRIEPIYVNIVLVLAPLFYLLGFVVLNWGAQESFYRTMVFLIGASPCALAATDIPATLSAISNLAKRGVLFKGGSFLSNFSEVNAIAFDKTGTLTQGSPEVVDVYSVDETITPYWTSLLVSMESQSNHPLAKAIINHFKEVVKIDVNVENTIGLGVFSTIEGVDYFIGKPSHYPHHNEIIQSKIKDFSAQGKTVIAFGDDQQILMLITLLDIAKVSSKEAVTYFKQNDIHTVMITGDTLLTAQTIGQQLQIDTIEANVLPQDKSSIIQSLKDQYKMVAMVGDGVNDAPALVGADIGVAMGEGTDIAIDVADVVLMKNDLSKLVYTHKVAKKLRQIVIQNVVFAMVVVLFLIVVNLLGMMNMSFAVVIHEGSTLVVILNGLRMLKTIKA